MEKKSKRDTVRAAKMILTAESEGVTKRTVERVLSADRNNDRILSTFFEIDEGINKLLEEVKKRVPL